MYLGVAASRYMGVGLVRGTLSSIIGERPEKSLAEGIQAEVLKYRPILGAYDLILHIQEVRDLSYLWLVFRQYLRSGSRSGARGKEAHCAVGSGRG